MHNEKRFASKEAFIGKALIYIGGNEHATGHLLYSRFWNKFLKRQSFAPTEEPFKKTDQSGNDFGD
jgi:leucyl-tRNA synthetase